MRRTRWRPRQLLWLLRRWPLQLITAVIMALTTMAIAAAAAVGLALVEPRARVYRVSLLSLLEANYAPWPDAGPVGRRLDPAILADIARDEQARNVLPALSDGALVPVDLPPLPQAVGSEAGPGEGGDHSASIASPQAIAQTSTPTYTPTPSISPSATVRPRPSATTGPVMSVATSPASPTRERPTNTIVPVTARPPAPTRSAPRATPLPPTSTPLPTSLVAQTAPTTTALPTDIPPSATQVPAQPPKPIPTAVPPTATWSAPTATPALATTLPTPTIVAPSATSTPPATALPTATAVPPTNTPTTPPATALPTATAVPPTNTPTTPPATALPTATAVPPTDTPTATAVPPTDTPTATAVPPTETPTATETPIPVPLVVEIVVPSDGAIVSSPAETNFRAIAYDPAVGTNDGDGITSVDLTITLISGSGSYGHNRNDTAAPYCAYGGSEACPTIPNWDNMEPGSYRLTATANAPGKPSVMVSVTFTKP